ncbi:MAG TPA: hypothetical protein VGV67_01690 [Solirubrobacteraceae bacterium]|nr:hypothetical protein [Solirubrobacteraceae bacterium]
MPPMPPSPPPALSTRLGDVPSSLVRDILELTEHAAAHVPAEIAERLARLGRAAAASA